jgi:hypothetical protein
MMNAEWNKSIASLYENKELLEKTADCRIQVGLRLSGWLDKCNYVESLSGW